MEGGSCSVVSPLGCGPFDLECRIGARVAVSSLVDIPPGLECSSLACVRLYESAPDREANPLLVFGVKYAASLSAVVTTLISHRSGLVKVTLLVVVT